MARDPGREFATMTPAEEAADELADPDAEIAE